MADAGVPVNTLGVECFAERTADVIFEEAKAWRADLIVIGTHGRRGVNRWMLGSDADRSCASPVPVLLVRSDDSAAGLPASCRPGGSVHSDGVAIV